MQVRHECQEFAGRAEQSPTSRVPRSMAIGVLIVEDEFLLRADAAEFMENSGFTVYEASNADEAIALLERHVDIRAVFTDIHMPGSMDGLKLAHYVRGRWPPIKLFIASGLARPLLANRMRVRRQAIPVE